MNPCLAGILVEGTFLHHQVEQFCELGTLTCHQRLLRIAPSMSLGRKQKHLAATGVTYPARDKYGAADDDPARVNVEHVPPNV